MVGAEMNSFVEQAVFLLLSLSGLIAAARIVPVLAI